MKCLTDEEMAVYLDNRRTDREYNRIAEHLSFCDSCMLRMTRVYDTMNVPVVASGGINVPDMPRAEKYGAKKIFRLRYFIPAAAAAAVVILVLLYGFNTPLKVNESKIISHKTNGHPDNTMVQKMGKNMFSLSLDPGSSARIKKDASSLTVNKTGFGVMSLQGYSDDSGDKTPTIDEKLAVERRLMLMRCGFYYFMIKHGGASSMLVSWNELLDMCFHGLELKGLSADFTGRFESEIAAREGEDRENFMAGFILAYFIYAEGAVSGDAESGAFIEKYLKSEKLLGIGDMVSSTGDERSARAEKIREYFVR